MPDTPPFRYRAIPNDQRPFEIFTSSVEYIVGDELPLSNGRWQVNRVIHTGKDYLDGQFVTVRTLHCSVED